MLQFMGSQTVGYDRVTELKRTELNSAILVHLSLLIPRISMFSLVISFLTTFNLPGFMDLTESEDIKRVSFRGNAFNFSPLRIMLLWVYHTWLLLC